MDLKNCLSIHSSLRQLPCTGIISDCDSGWYRFTTRLLGTFFPPPTVRSLLLPYPYPLVSVQLIFFRPLSSHPPNPRPPRLAMYTDRSSDWHIDKDWEIYDRQAKRKADGATGIKNQSGENKKNKKNRVGGNYGCNEIPTNQKKENTAENNGE